MKIILFDLGNTLEDQIQGDLLPGALDMLNAIRAMRDQTGKAPALALVSDFGQLEATPAQIKASWKEYLKILKDLGIRQFFTPAAKRITLSTEVGAAKPSSQIFQAAIDKIGGTVHFQDVMFITENRTHVFAARQLGMTAIHFKGPGETTGDIVQLIELLPLVQGFLQ